MTLEREHSEDAFKPVRFLGKWWIPGSDAQLPGELVFNPTCRSILEIVGKLASTFSDVPVIHGETTDGTRITLFNSHVCGVSLSAGPGSPATSQKISVFDVWTGPRWFSTKADVVFQSYSFGIHDLANWADRNCFSGRFDNDHLAITLTCTVPCPIRLFENERLSVSLTSLPVSSHGQDKKTIELFHRIVIRSKRGLLPYYGDTDSISECEWMIFVLIALLMGCTTWKFGFAGKLPPSPDRAGLPPEEPVRHFVRTDWEAPQPLCEPSTVELLFPYDSLGPQFPAIAAAFSKLFRVNASQIEVLFRFRCRERGYDAAALPNLLFAFDQLEAKLLAKQNEPFEQEGKAYAERIRNLLRPHCPKDDWDWVKSKVSWQGLPYKKRLDIAFKTMHPLFPELVGELASKLIGYLSNTRHTYAHEAKATSDDFSRYVRATDWMGDFLTLLIVHACGVPLETIKAIYFRQFASGNWKTEQLFKLFRHQPNPPLPSKPISPTSATMSSAPPAPP